MKSLFKNISQLILAVSISAGVTHAKDVPDGYRLVSVNLPEGAVSILGICHKPDGTLAVVSWEGEVWEYKSNKWSKFAENLMEPAGIHYDAKEKAYYVAQKPELTRLTDTDNDGVCDKYECITDTFGTTGSYHEYHYGPVSDSLGRKYASINLAARGIPGSFGVENGKPHGVGGPNMYYSADYQGWVYRSDRKGHFHPIASGFRSPCGIGMSPEDELFITDNQGDWMPTCALFHVQEGNFYGHPASLIGRADYTKEKVLSMSPEDFDSIRTLPAVWLPQDIIASSPGSPVWDTTEGKFGPFKGQIFAGDQRLSNYFRCGVEEINGAKQGWCIDFIRGTTSGTVKMAFDAKGKLWSAQVGRGWYSKGGKRTALQYAAWDGKTVPFAIHSSNLTENGFKINFTKPIEEAITPTVKNWHYDYNSIYGSPLIDEKEVTASNITLSKDRKSITIDVPLEKRKVYSIQFANQVDEAGAALDTDTIYYTVNRLHSTTKQEKKKAQNVGWKLVGSGWERNDVDRPLPPIVYPKSENVYALPAPAEAIQLDQDQWSNANWKFNEQGIVTRSAKNNTTKKSFGDARFHIEFMFPESNKPEDQGQKYGNSGIFLMKNYELQVVNSYQNPTFADGHCGAIYGQHPPLVNASKPPGKWQAFDILMKAPRFDEDGKLIEPLRMTVHHNGVLIQDDVSLYGAVKTAYEKHGKLPLMLQDHKGSPVHFRNIWAIENIDYDKELPVFRKAYTYTPATPGSPHRANISHQ